MALEYYLYVGINPVLNAIFKDFVNNNVLYKLHKPNNEVFVNGFYSAYSPEEIEPYVRDVLNEMALYRIISITPEDVRNRNIARIQMKNRAGLCVVDANPENRFRIYEVKKIGHVD